MPSPRGRPDLDEDGARGCAGADGGERLARRCGRSTGTAARVWTLLTTVGMPNRPRSRRVGRALLGLAALALERLEQDRLLAQHVGALDRPDLDSSMSVAAAEDVVAEEARAPSAAPMAASSRAMTRWPRRGRR